MSERRRVQGDSVSVRIDGAVVRWPDPDLFVSDLVRDAGVGVDVHVFATDEEAERRRCLRRLRFGRG